jgi:competence protein ComGC
MKKIPFILGASILLAISSCKDPSANAESKGNAAADAADEQATVAIEQQEAADINATNAVVNAVIANADELMSKVPMPTLSSMDAKIYEKKIGNHVVDFVNAKDESQASKYMTKVQDELAKVDDLTAKGKISAADSKAIKDYATSLMNAAGLTVTVVK